MRKSYCQYCPVAHALDLVGERWALLIVRELLRGPKRYTDLAEALPGIGTNILAGRLRDLEAAGVVRKRRLPPPAAVTVYELTEYGVELREPIYALARWGARTLGPPTLDEELRTGWLMNAVSATFDERAARGVRRTYEVRSGDEVVGVSVDDGTASVEPGAAEKPDAVIESDPKTLFRLVSRELAPSDALEQGLVRLEGPTRELARFVSLFSFEAREQAA